MRDARERFMEKVSPEPMSGCWLWTAATRHGYGCFSVGRGSGKRKVMAHRYAYEMLRGPIPDLLSLDHKCRIRCCVNPWHLEPVSNRDNAIRGFGVSGINFRKTHCPRWHPLSGENLRLNKKGARLCRICESVRMQLWRQGRSARLEWKSL